MGLTIHYGLTTDLADIDSIRTTVQRIRQLALRLPFLEVGNVIECQDKDCGHNRDDPHRWLKIQAGQYVKDGDHYIKVMPLHFVAFTILPGAGSEPANIGLARYPEIVEVPELDKQIKTDLTGWSWKSFCYVEVRIMQSSYSEWIEGCVRDWGLST